MPTNERATTNEQPTEIPVLTLTQFAQEIGLPTTPLLPADAPGGQFVRDEETGHYIHVAGITFGGLKHLYNIVVRHSVAMQQIIHVVNDLQSKLTEAGR